MTIIEKIKQSVEGATSVPFLYHAAGELNELIARCNELPVAYSFLIENGAIDDVNGRYHERVTIAVIFCDKTEFDFNAIENEQIIDRMKVKAFKWLQSLRMNNALRVVSVNNTQRLYDNTTDVLTGYAVNITIEDVAGVGECELPEVVIDVDKNGSYDVVGVDKVRVNVVPRLEELEVAQNGEYLPPTDIAGFSKVNVDVQPTLEELTVTANGEYLPQEGVDGFSKVVAEFDISSLPKVRASLLRINDNCIDDNGQWIGGEFVDFSAITSMSNFTRGCRNIKNFENINWNFLPNTGGWDYAFEGCVSLTHLDFTNANKTKVTTLWSTFGSTRVLISLKGLDKLDVSECKDFAGFISEADCEEIDITSWDFVSATRIANVFYFCTQLKSFIGNKTIEDVIQNDIKAFTNAKVNINIGSYAGAIERPSLRALINGLADLTGKETKILTLTGTGQNLIAKLTEEDIAIATAKNWTIV